MQGFLNYNEDEEMSEVSYDEEEAKPEQAIEMPADTLQENVYGFVMASLIRDSADIKNHGYIKFLRILSAFLVYFIMFGLQAFLLAMTKKLVSPVPVAAIREEYGYFEKMMYTDDAGKQHTVDTVNGYPRGLDGFFNKGNFAKLTQDHKSQICLIPMSQLPFLLSVLTIWLLTVLSQIKISLNTGLRLLNVPTLSPDEDHPGLRENDDGEFEVIGLPLYVKCLIIIFITIPRICLSLFMGWLGARWLTATLGYGDVLLNALALAFIFDLATLIYDSMVPFHNKLIVQKTLLPHIGKSEPESFKNLFGMLFLGVLAAILAVIYVFYLQQVLPGYRFDVAEVCKYYLEVELSV